MQFGLVQEQQQLWYVPVVWVLVELGGCKNCLNYMQNNYAKKILFICKSTNKIEMFIDYKFVTRSLQISELSSTLKYVKKRANICSIVACCRLHPSVLLAGVGHGVEKWPEASFLQQSGKAATSAQSADALQYLRTPLATGDQRRLSVLLLWCVDAAAVRGGWWRSAGLIP